MYTQILNVQPVQEIDFQNLTFCDPKAQQERVTRKVSCVMQIVIIIMSNLQPAYLVI